MQEVTVEIAGLVLGAGADQRATIQSASHTLDTTGSAVGARRCEDYHPILERGGAVTAAISMRSGPTSSILAEAALAHATTQPCYCQR